MNLHITEQGKGSPLVFFHGWGFDSQIWQRILPKLENDYRVYCVDLPGLGLTDYMEYEKWKEKVLHILPFQFAAIGWSLGGLYATRLAIEEPARITHLLNITSSPRFLEDTHWAGVKPQILHNFYHQLSEDSEKTIRQFRTLNQGSPDLSEIVKPSEQGLYAGLEVLQKWDLRDHLPSLKPRTCYMFGRLDPITSIATLQTMQNLYSQFRYVLFKKSGHMPFLSESTRFLEELRAFLNLTSTA
jgi:pimeloyl-[acyl-carrier protein] methyl ester esterase